MTIAREEIFGPVLTILAYDSIEQAIEIANDTEYGLAGYVSAADLEQARKVARRIRAGSVAINHGVRLECAIRRLQEKRQRSRMERVRIRRVPGDQGRPRPRARRRQVMASPKKLVIGASGFVGSHVTRQLVENGEDVRVMIRKTSSTKAFDDLDVERHHGDVFDDEALRAAMAGCDVVYHCVVDTRFWLRDAAPLFRTNVEGLRHVLDAAVAADLKRFVFTSTIGTLARRSLETGHRGRSVQLARRRRSVYRVAGRGGESRAGLHPGQGSARRRAMHFQHIRPP